MTRSPRRSTAGWWWEAQMRLPENVLGIAGEVSHALRAVYGSLRRLDDCVPRPGDSPAAVREDIDALWGRLREMRRAMRADLGADGRDRRAA
ncbi:hypothetical protein [Streptomyces marianii]|uniref:hypothetical protein n=1 Tax=Streptomyces marianii TaxID=1817406 RepID=UPI0018F8C25B|nr:hypothetical protein [Streptomyces marianii]